MAQPDTLLYNNNKRTHFHIFRNKIFRNRKFLNLPMLLYTIGDWQRATRKRFPADHFDPLLAERLLGHVLKLSLTELFVESERRLTQEQIKALECLLICIKRKVPIDYILGYTEFLDHRFCVSPDTLIPRSSSQTLVQEVIGLHSKAQRILELGVGSGALILSIAKRMSQANCYGVERCAHALEIAKCNQQRLKIDNVQWAMGDWYDPWGWFEKLTQQARWDVIFSNPPYIDLNTDPDFDLSALQHEPACALFAEDNGLADLYHLIKTAKKYLNRNGWLLLEHGWRQAEAVSHALHTYGYSEVTTVLDELGHSRMTKGKALENGL